MKTIGIFIALVIIFVGIAIVGTLYVTKSYSPETTEEPGILEADVVKYDFGEISMADGVVSTEFELNNNSRGSVKIEKAYTSCGCTTAKIVDDKGKEYGKFGMQGHGLPTRTSVLVEPEEKVKVRVFFDPAAHGLAGLGYVTRAVYLETDSEESPKLQVVINAQVVR